MPTRQTHSKITSIVFSNIEGTDAIGKGTLIPLDQPMSAEQLAQRARLVQTILETRKRVQTMRDRTAALNGALEAFRDRQDQIRRRA